MGISGAFFLLALLPLFASCSSGNSSNEAQTPCDKTSSIRGTIAKVLKAGILIDGTPEKQQAAYDKVYAFSNQQTRIFEKQGSQCQQVSFTALKLGKRVQVQAASPTQQSYPPQLVASEIVLLPPES